MISGLDHVVVLVEDIGKGAAAYQTLLGRTPSWRYSSDGADRVLFTLDNITLELVAPSGDGAAGDRIREAIKASGEGLASICFATPDIAKMHRRLERVALKPEPVAEVESRDAASGAAMKWKRTRAATDLTRGVRLFFLELDGERPRSQASGAAPIVGLDHVVVATEDSERAAALYGARLGLDMALDRTPSGLGTADVLPLRRPHRRGGAAAGRRRRRHARQTVGPELAGRRHRRGAGAALGRWRRRLGGAHRPQARHTGDERAQRHLRRADAVAGAVGARRSAHGPNRCLRVTPVVSTKTRIPWEQTE